MKSSYLGAGGGGCDVEDLDGVVGVGENLHLLMVMVYMIGLMLNLFVVVWLLVVLLGMEGVRDDPLVVGWLGSGHSVLGGLGLWAVPGGVCAVFAVEQAVESLWLLSSSPAPSSCVVAVALRGVFLAVSSLSGRMLVGYGVHLLLVAIVPAGVRLCRPNPSSAGLWRALGFL
jgi:hypothetical protein